MGDIVLLEYGKEHLLINGISIVLGILVAGRVWCGRVSKIFALSTIIIVWDENMVLYNGMLSMSRRPLQEEGTIDSISIVSLPSRVGQEKILDENRNRPDGIPYRKLHERENIAACVDDTKDTHLCPCNGVRIRFNYVRISFWRCQSMLLHA